MRNLLLMPKSTLFCFRYTLFHILETCYYYKTIYFFVIFLEFPCESRSQLTTSYEDGYESKLYIAYSTADNNYKTHLTANVTSFFLKH